jgi:HD-GYP domain-containing protein (c-di-GMP phosphodiesterase class II)
MGKNKIYLKIDELKPGMIIADEVKFNNATLLTSGSVVTEDIISRLTVKYFFDKISVYSEETLNEDSAIVNENRTIKEIEESFNEFANNVENLFSNINSGMKLDLEEVRDFTRKIQNELKSTSAIIKNIVLYGSGNDVIYKHSVNVAALSAILGKWIGMSDKDINLLTYTGILHDFGKTKIDKNILGKVGALTSKEREEIRNHSIIGYNFIKKIPYISNSVCSGVLMHHERLDGSGYPLGIKEDKIHVFAKIIAIADIFDAVNSDRIYKNGTDPFTALQIVQKEGLGRLDYKFCKIFIDNIINYYMGEKVLLNTNKECKIIQINVNDLCRPLLFDGSEFIDLKLEGDLYVKELIV